MMNKTMKRILTMALAVIMALSSLSGAFPTAFADEDVYDGLVTAEEPSQEPAEESAEEPSDEPSKEPIEEPTEEPSQEPIEEPYDVEPEPEPEPEPVIETAALDAVLIVSNEEAVRLTSEEGAVLAEAVPELRLWSEEEEAEYGVLLEGIEGEVFAKLALYDAVTEERGISLTGTVNVKLSGGIVENAAELRAYTVTESGELLELELDDNAFEADCVSLLVLAGTEKEEPAEEPAEENDHSGAEIYDNLVETPASNDEPLLQLDELSDETLALLGVERKGTPRPAGKDPSALRPGAGLINDGEVITAGEDGLMPWEADLIKIDNLTINWIPNSYGQTVDPTYCHIVCTDDSVAERQFEINISISGTSNIAAGELELVLPAFLWKTRPVRNAEGEIVTEGNETGTLYFRVPEEPDHSASFAWRRIGDNIVITNTHMLPGATAAFIQGAFSGETAHEMEDGTRSVDFNVRANLSVPSGKVLERYGNMSKEEIQKEDGTVTSEYRLSPIYATIDTYVSLDNASKNAKSRTGVDNVFLSVPTSLPDELKPENPENYLYVRWAITAQASGTQPYLMTFTDTLPDEDYETLGGRILGAEALIGVYNDNHTVKKAEDGRSISAVLYDGYTVYSKTAIVWAAYPKENFSSDDVFHLHNNATVTVKGADEEIPGAMTDFDQLYDRTIELSAEATFGLPKTYTVTKVWEHGDNTPGLYPSTLGISIYRDGLLWQSVVLSRTNDWTYSWSDDDKAHTYDVSENSLPAGSYVRDLVDEYGISYREYTNWHYEQKSKVYDAETRTWTFTNEYKYFTKILDIIPFHTPGAATKTEKWAEDHKSGSLTSSTDSDLNALLRGKPVMLSYTLRGEGVLVDYTYGGEYSTEYIILEDEYDRFGQRPARYELVDEQAFIRDSAKPNGGEEYALNADDYDIVSVTMDQPILSVLWQVDEYSEWNEVTDENMSREAEIVLYGCSKNADGEFGDWIPYASIKNGRIAVQNGAEVSGKEVYLPSGVNKVKQQIETKAHFIKMGYTVTVRIKPSQRVLEEIVAPAFERDESVDYVMLTVRNTAASYISDPDHSDRAVLSKADSASAYLHGRNFKNAVTLNNTYEYFGDKQYYIDNSTGTIKFRNKLTLIQQSNVLDRDYYSQLIRNGNLSNTKGGTFYALLPAGVQPNCDSIAFEEPFSGDKILSAYVIPNYEGTGRAMLVMKVSFSDHPLLLSSNGNYRIKNSNYPATGWANVHTVTYESNMSLVEIYNRQTDLGILPYVNSVAFEADEETLGDIEGWKGERDRAYYENNNDYENCRTIELRYEKNGYVQDDRILMSDLDPDRNYPNFVYALAGIDITDDLLFGVYNSDKQVSVDGINWTSGNLDKTVSAYEGSIYTYRITATPDAADSIKRVTFFDPLEMYQPTQTEEEDYSGSFRGVIESVDTSALESNGMTVAVYYYVGGTTIVNESGETVSLCDVKNSYLSVDLNDGNWTQTMPEDHSLVTAVYVTAEKSGDINTEFYAGRKLIVDIIMRAPVEKENENILFPDKNSMQNPDKNAHAYNVAAVAFDIISDSGEERANPVVTTQYTKLGILPYTVIVAKTWIDMNDNDRVRPDSITVDLYGDGEYIDTIELTADDNWQGRFEHVRRFNDDFSPVEYTLVEHPIEAEGAVQYTAQVRQFMSGNSGVGIEIINRHERITTRIPFTKQWIVPVGEDDTRSRPSEINVLLYVKELDQTSTAETGEPKYNIRFTGKTMTVRPDENGDWSGEFSGSDLYKYLDGEKIEYVVREAQVYKYYSEYDETNFNDPQIINTFYPYGNLTVRKTVDNQADYAQNAEFSFTLLLSYEGTGLTELFSYNKYDGDSEEPVDSGTIGNGGEFTLKDGQRIEILNILSETEYTVIENPAKGYYIQSQGGSSGIIRAHETKYANFVNAYRASANADITVTKVLKGGSIGFKQFTFSLVNAETGKVVGTAYTSVTPMDINTHEAIASVIFPRLYFTAADDGKTYKYYIRENIPEDAPDYYTYDESEFTFTITLSDNGDGTMSKVVSYGKLDPDGAEQEIDTEPTFTNEYHATGEVTLKAWKTLKGGTVSEYDFLFEIVKPDGTQLATAECGADGTIVFPPIMLNENDIEVVNLLVVREVNTGNEAVIYDENVFGYDVRAIDRGDGTLLFRTWLTAVEKNEDGIYVEADDEVEPVFRNSLKAGSLSVTNIEKWAEGQEPESEDITFHVEFSGELLPESVTYEKLFANLITVGVGGQYQTLQDAFDAAQDGDTIVLVSDLEHNSTATLRGNRDVTLDLKGFTINNNASGFAVVVPEGSSLTLEDGAWVGGSLFDVYGELTFNSGEYSADDTLFEAHASSDGAETVVVDGGVFQGGNVSNNEGVNYIIYDGQFNGVSYSLDNGESHPFCYGGSYTQNPKTQLVNGSNLVPVGYKVVTGVDTIPGYSGTVYTVVPDPNAPKVVKNRTTGKEYPSLNEAIREASSGDTIVPLSDFAISESTLVAGKIIVFDFTGYGVTVKNSVTVKGENAELYVAGGSWSGQNDFFVLSADAELKIAGGSFAAQDGAAIVHIIEGNATVTGGHLKSGTVSAEITAPYGFEITAGAVSQDVSFDRNGGTWPFISGGLFEISPDMYPDSIMPGYFAHMTDETIPGYSGTVHTVSKFEDAEDDYPVIIAETGEKFRTLSSAFKAAENGQTVKLISNYTLNYETVPSGKTLKLDLDAYNIIAESPTGGIYLDSSSSELSISGGAWKNNSTGSMLYVLNGTLNVLGGTWSGTDGCLISASGSSSIVRIKDGIFTSEKSIFKSDSNADFIIAGGDFLKGEITGSSGNGNGGYNITDGAFRKTVTFGGSFNGGFIRGGLYAMELSAFSDYVASGYMAAAKGDIIEGYSGVVYSIVADDGDTLKPFRVESSGQDYKTIIDAVSASENEDVITVTADTTILSAVISGKKITVQAGSHKLSIKSNATITVTGNGKLTLVGGTWEDAAYRSVSFIIADGGSLLIKSGVYKITNSASYVITVAKTGNAEIGGGEFYCGRYSSNNLLLYAAGYLTITGGYYSGIVKIAIDSAVSISGGYFAYNPQVESYSIPGFISGGFYTDSINTARLAGGYVCRTTDANDKMLYQMSYKVIPDADANPVARIVRDEEEKLYYTLEEAFSAAKDGEVIELINDVQLRAGSKVLNKNITLNAGEHEITVAGSDMYISVSGGSLAIDNGTWYFEQYSAERPFILAESGAKLKVNGGEWLLNSGNITLFKAASGADVAVMNGEFDLGSPESIAVYSEDGSSAAVNGGYFNNCGIYGPAEVKGGKFGTNVSFFETVLTGGYFALDPDYINLFVTRGHMAVEAENVKIPYYSGTVYTVGTGGEVTAVAENTRSGEKYAKLSTALAEASEGDTVKLLKNAFLDSAISLSEKITLDLNEKTVTATCDASLNLFSGADVTIKGGDWVFSESTAAAFSINSDAVLTVESGNIKKTNDSRYCLFDLKGGELTIAGGTFDWYGDSIILGESYGENKLTVNGGSFTNRKNSAKIIDWSAGSGTYASSEIKDGEFKLGRMLINNARLSILGGLYLVGVVFESETNIDYIKGGHYAMAQSTFEPYISYNYYYRVDEDYVLDGYDDSIYEVFCTDTFEIVARDRKSGDEFYSLDDALTKSIDGADIELLADTFLYTNVTISGKTISLDLNGHTVDTSSKYFTVKSSATLILDGGEWKDRTTHENNLFYVSTGSTIYVKGGKFTNARTDNQYYLINAYSTDANAIITGGVFDAIKVLAANSDADHFSAVTGGKYLRGMLKSYNSAGGGLSVRGGIYGPDFSFDLAKTGDRFIRGGSFALEKSYIEQFTVPGYAPFEDDAVTLEGFESETFYTVREHKDADKVAEIVESGAKYLTLQDAINSAGNNQTVKLLKDIVLSDNLSIPPKALTLDLGSHQIKICDSHTVRIETGADLTIRNGSWSIGTDNLFTVESLASLTVENGDFNTSSTDSNKYLFRVNGGALSIIDGEFTSNNSIIWCSEGSKLLIKGGEFTANNSKYILYYLGTNTASEISGGQFIKGRIHVDNRSLTITGGAFSMYNGVTIQTSSSSFTPVHYFIRGGYFAGSLEYRTTSNSLWNVQMLLCGGYSVVEDEGVKTYFPDYTGTELYKVIPDEVAGDPIAVDNLGRYFYGNLDNILYEADYGSTVTLLKDVEGSGTLYYWSLTLDLNGYATEYGFKLDHSTAIIKGKTGSKVNNASMSMRYYSKLTIEGGEFTSQSSTMFDVSSDYNCSLEIKDGVFNTASDRLVVQMTYDKIERVAISGGEFNGGWILHATISGGIFRNVTCDSCNISGGIFRGGVCSGTISGGLFYDSVEITGSGSTISGGYFAMDLSDPEKLDAFKGKCRAYYIPQETDMVLDDYDGIVYEVRYDPDYYEAIDDRGNKYPNLDSAFTKAEDGAVITLVQNSTLTSSQTINKKLTLDLGGCTVYDDCYQIYIREGGDLTVRGTGTWITRYLNGGKFCVNPGGKLTIEEGTFIDQATGDYALIYIQGGEVEITGGVFEWKAYVFIYAYDYSTNKLTISGGDYTNDFENGYYTCGDFVNWPSVSGTANQSEISGGVFRTGSFNLNGDNIEITGGKFLSGVQLDSCKIRGGLWAFEPDSRFIHSAYRAVISDQTLEAPDGSEYDGEVYEVILEGDPVAEDENGTKYYTAYEALYKAPSGSTVTMLKDAELSYAITLSKTLTLDLGESTLSIAKMITLASGADITVTGSGTLNSTTTGQVYYISKGAKLKIESGSYTGNGTLFYIYGGELEISDGLFYMATIVRAQTDVSGSTEETSSLKISGGDFSAYNSILEWGPMCGKQKNSEITGGTFRKGNFSVSQYSKLTVTGGVFYDEVTLPSYSSYYENRFIQGGYWAFIPDSRYIVSGYSCVESEKEFEGITTVYELEYTGINPDITNPIAKDETGRQFESFEDISANSTDGSVITFIKSVTLDSSCTFSGKKLTLNTNYTITVNGSIYLNLGADITIKGSGTWKAQYGIFVINSGAKLRVESGKFTKTTSDWGNLFQVNGGELEITGGTYSWSYDDIIYSYNANSKLTISGGDFSNTYSTLDRTTAI